MSHDLLKKRSTVYQNGQWVEPLDIMEDLAQVKGKASRKLEASLSGKVVGNTSDLA